MNRLLTLVLVVLIGANVYYAWYQNQLAHPTNSELDADIATIDAEIKQAETDATQYQKGIPRHLPERPVFVASFKDLDRWSHSGILRQHLHLAEPTPKFPLSPVGEVGKVSYGLQKHPGNRPGIHARPYLRVANVQRSRLDLAVIKTINVPDEDMPKYRLEEGDVLLCEGNSAELVGRGAIWRNEIPNCVHQNHVLRVRIDKARALPEFVLSVINSNYGQAYFRSKAKKTTNLASINSKEVARLPLPLPTIDEQRSFMAGLDAAYTRIVELRENAAKVRSEAWRDFETAVYAAEEATAPDSIAAS